MATEHPSARQKLVNKPTIVAAALALAMVFASIALAASAAQAAKAKGKGKKAPVYAASAEASGFWNVTRDCDYSSNLTYQYRGTYVPTTLDGTSTLDARKRTGSGLLDWRLDCSTTGSHEAGSCGLEAETPPGGIHAGDEDGVFDELNVGDPVPFPGGGVSGARHIRVDFSNILLTTGEQFGCRGSLWGSGLSGADEYRAPQGFFQAKRIGQKEIVVRFSGYRRGSYPGQSVSGEMSGTLILIRLKNKKR